MIKKWKAIVSLSSLRAKRDLELVTVLEAEVEIEEIVKRVEEEGKLYLI